MWLYDHSLKDTTAANKFTRLTDGMRKVLELRHKIQVGVIGDWPSVIKLLLRVRREHRPGRMLFLPPWVFGAAGMEAPDTFRQWNKDGWMGSGIYPSEKDEDAGDDRIIISHNEFNYFQKRLLHHFKFWDPEIRLHKAVTDLEEQVKYLKNVGPETSSTDDTLKVAQQFFALQRRRQLKVVSNFSSTTFLPKGGSATIFQNSPTVLSTFEEKLSAFSGQKGLPIKGDTPRLMQKCCLLMEEYVTVYAKGDRKRLVFVRGVSGGSGRGSVDTYNLLVDLLRYIRDDEQTAGLKKPGPCHKFLAEDIKAYNTSFTDDAFAEGKIPAWETWNHTQ